MTWATVDALHAAAPALLAAAAAAAAADHDDDDDGGGPPPTPPPHSLCDLGDRFPAEPFSVWPGRPMSDPAVAPRRGRFALTATGVLYGDPESGRAVRFPRVADGPLLDRIVAAVSAAAPDILAEQERAGWEIAGIITADADLRDVRVTVCEQSRGAAYSSDPYCAGVRRCLAPELRAGRVVLGEFHSHPDRGSPRVDFFPPSGNDLYQLGVAAMSGVHNLSVVVAVEGLYVARVRTSASVRLNDDLVTFYRQNRVDAATATKSMRACRQPIVDVIDRNGSTPCLAAFFDATQTVYADLIGAADLSTKQRIAAYVRTVERRLGVTVRFVAHAPHVDTLGRLRRGGRPPPLPPRGGPDRRVRPHRRRR